MDDVIWSLRFAGVAVCLHSFYCMFDDWVKYDEFNSWRLKKYSLGGGEKKTAAMFMIDILSLWFPYSWRKDHTAEWEGTFCSTAKFMHEPSPRGFSVFVSLVQRR